MKGSSHIDAGDGNNRINLNADVYENVTVKTGSGNDTIRHNGIMKVYNNDLRQIDTGAGDDSVYLKELNIGKVHTGAGNDTVTADRIYSGAQIYLESGNDTLIYNAQNRNDPKAYGIVRGGEGEDTLVLSQPAGNAFYSLGLLARSNITNAGTDTFKGFEKVKLGVGSVFDVDWHGMYDGGGENSVSKIIIEKGDGDGVRKVDIGNNKGNGHLEQPSYWTYDDSVRQYWTQGNNVTQDGKEYRTFTLDGLTIWVETGITLI